MKKYLIMFLCFIGFACITSCSESDEESTEFDDWQSKNESYFSGIYTKASSAISAGDNKWKIFRVYSKVGHITASQTDDIVVEVLNVGSGKDTPLFTDSVRVHYEGRLIPTNSYPDGYVFDKSWTGSYNLQTMIPTKFAVSGVVDGFCTALMNMRAGDRWRVYIPYQLGYGSTATSTIPAYSTLIFDITLHSLTHPGTPFLPFQ